MPELSSRLNFPYIISSHILDALVQPVVEAVLVTIPPNGPTAGMLYVIGTAPGGIWSGKGNCLAQYLGETWAFYVPFEGLTVWNKATKTYWYYTGIQWSESKTDQHLKRTDNPHAVTATQIGAETPAGSQSKIDTHTGKAVGAHPATAVSVTAVGSISATNVQAALVELDTEKSPTNHTHSTATTAANGFMAGSDKQKLDGIAAGAEVNQNAFSTIVAGGVSAVADSKTDTFAINAGAGITVTGDATNDACTIAITANGHTHSDATPGGAGFMPAAMVTKLNGIAAGAQVNQNAFNSVLVGTTTVAADAVNDTLELVAGPNITLTPDATNDRVTIGVSGTVPSATAATTAGTCTGNSATATVATAANLLSSLGNYVSAFSALPLAYGHGVTTSFVQPGDGWPSYGSILTIRGYVAGGGTLQLYSPYSPKNGGSRIQFRLGNYEVNNGNSWTGMQTLANITDIPTSLPANGGTSAVCSGNAATATTLATARTIGISGDATGTATSFNGSANIAIPLVLAASGVTAGTYTSVTVDAKGRVTAATNPATISASTTGNAATATKLATARTINGVAFDGTANITIASVATATTANNIPTADVGGNIWIA